MKFNEIRPHVLNVTPRKYTPDVKRQGQTLHWIILYVMDGRGEIRFGTSRPETVSENCAVLMPPGTAYALRTLSDEINGIMVEFDIVPDLSPEAAARQRIDDLSFLNEPRVVTEVPPLKEFLQEALEVYMRREPMWEMSVGSMCVGVMTIIARAANSKMHYLVKQVIDLISERYDQTLGNSDIAEVLGKHPNYINAVFVRDMGMSIHQYVMRYRIGKAEQLLLTTQKPISEVARDVGFRHFSHFSNCFHKMTGYAPATYRMER